MSRSHTSPKLSSSINSWINCLTLKEDRTIYALEGYKVFFSAKLARQYEPIVYSSECMSGDPEALYYRILQNDEKMNSVLILLLLAISKLHDDFTWL